MDDEFNQKNINDIKKENEWLVLLTKERSKDFENI